MTSKKNCRSAMTPGHGYVLGPSSRKAVLREVEPASSRRLARRCAHEPVGRLLVLFDQTGGQLPEATLIVGVGDGDTGNAPEIDGRAERAPQKNPAFAGRTNVVGGEDDGVDAPAIDLVVDEGRARRAVGVVRAELPAQKTKKPGTGVWRQVLQHFELDWGKPWLAFGVSHAALPPSLPRKARAEYIEIAINAGRNECFATAASVLLSRLRSTRPHRSSPWPSRSV